VKKVLKRMSGKILFARAMEEDVSDDGVEEDDQEEEEEEEE